MEAVHVAYPGYVSPVFVDSELREILAQSIARDEARRAADEREEKEYAAVISAKRERDQQSYAEFRALDQKRWEQQRKEVLQANLRTAREAVEDAKAYVAECDPHAALTRFRDAEDKWLAAAENLKQCRAAVVAAKQSGTDQQVTDALVREQKAGEWAAELKAAMEAACTVKDEAEDALAGAHAELADAEKQLADAKRNAKAPLGEAPVSRTTAKHCGAGQR
jgi:hypothetical protein